MAVRVETETSDVVLSVLRPDRLKHANRYHVLRFCEGHSQAHGALISAVVVLRFPHLPAGQRGVHHDGSVVDDGGRRKALLEGRGIDEGLEARSRLPPGLSDVVELVAVEIESSDERTHCAVLRIRRYERTLGVRDLDDLPVVLTVLLNAYHGAGSDPPGKRRPRIEHALGELEAFP